MYCLHYVMLMCWVIEKSGHENMGHDVNIGKYLAFFLLLSLSNLLIASPRH